MKYFSTFSGIGGFELGIEQAYEICNANRSEDGRGEEDSQRNERQGLQPTKGKEASSEERPTSECPPNEFNERPLCVGFSEIDKYATQIYQKHFPNHKNYGDITKINPEELPDFDLFVGGFPCQAFSIAGKRRGFEDTRGTLFFEIARIVRKKQPRLLLLENVKGLLSHDKGKTFYTIITTLDELGYDTQWQVLNSKNHGVPQNRERVFIIGHLRGTSRPEVFPFTESSGIYPKEITSKVSDAQRIYTTSCAKTLKGDGGGQGAKTGLYAIPANSYCLDANYHKGTNTLAKSRRSLVLNAQTRSPDRPSLKYSSGGSGPLFKEDRAFCLGTGGPGQYLVKPQIRRLTPTECERLQGFPDGWTEGVSDTQRYKTLGNAVTVNVIQDIMERLL